MWLFKRSVTLRKLILGRLFIEGTWVGHYKHGDEHRITKEFLDQSTGKTIIRGGEFDSNGNTIRFGSYRS